MALIEVENLVKHYRVARRRAGLWGAAASLLRRRHEVVRALDGVSFSLDAGELLGLIGPNGAGKSSTVKILSGILAPDSGRAEVAGLTPWRRRVETVRRLGVVFGQRTQLWWDLPVIESFELLAAIYRIERGAYRRSLDELVAALDIEGVLDTPVRQLSLGNRMRCDLAAALLHAPPIVFLDEPTIGLDAASKLAVRAFLKRINRQRDVSVILTTHDMDDVESLCRRVVVIHAGRVFLDGTLEQLRRRVDGERRLTVDLAAPADSLAEPGVREISREGLRVTLAFDPARTPAADLIARLAGRCQIRDLFVENPPIERIVAALYTAQEQPA